MTAAKAPTAADPVTLSPVELARMRHAIGWPRDFRNHYCIDPRLPDGQVWERLVARGLAARGGSAGGGRLFYKVTDAGRAAIRAYDGDRR